MNIERHHDRETVFQISVAMAALWALCWIWNQWEVPQLPPVSQQEMSEYRQQISK